LDGLSGWLILVGFGLVIGPFRLLRTIMTVNIPYLYGSQHEAYLSSHPASAALILFELVSNSTFVATSAYLNFLFYKKKRAFPTSMILFLAIEFAVMLLDTVGAHFLHPTVDLTKEYAGLAGSGVAALIWISYFLLSRRVKATFTR